MTDKTTEQAIQLMVDRLVARFDPDQIILFGSQGVAQALNFRLFCRSEGVWLAH